MSEVPRKTLDLIVKRLIRAAQPTKIILFGSHARGDAEEGSDLDLLVVKREVANRLEEIVRLREAIGKVGMGIDLLVYTPDEFDAKRDWSSTAIYWAVREGKTLYETPA